MSFKKQKAAKTAESIPMKLLLILFAFLLFIPVEAQEMKEMFHSYAGELPADGYCEWYKQEPITDDEEAEQIIDKLLAPLGLPRNFITVSCPDVYQAVALQSGNGIRYILYQNSFVTKTGKTGKWDHSLMLAHLAGLHFTGSTLNKQMNPDEKWQRVLIADEFSGFLLQRLGASWPEATRAMKKLLVNFNNRSLTHPTLSERLTALKQGYETGIKGEKVANIFNKSELEATSEYYFNKGRQLYEGAQYEQSIQFFTSAINVNSRHAAAFTFRADSWSEIGNYQQAIADLTVAIGIIPDYSWAYNMRGYMKDEIKEFEAAIEDFTKAIEIDDEYAAAYLNRGRARRSLEDFIGAIDDFKKAIQLDPKDYDNYNSLGVTRYEMGDYQEAIKEYNKAIKLNPEYSFTYFNKGIAEYALENYRDAIADFTKAIELDSTEGDFYHNRGVVKYNLNDFQGALADYSTALELSPDDPVTYEGSADSKYQLADYRGAISDYTAAIQLNPEDSELYNSRGMTKDELGDYQGAVKDFNEALQLDPNNLEALNNRGVSHFSLGNYTESCKDFQDACVRGLSIACENMDGDCK